MTLCNSNIKYLFININYRYIFRCIRINGKFDPMIGEAGETAGLSAKFLHQIFPSELTLWVDPLEVSYRIGENGSICVLYEYQV